MMSISAKAKPNAMPPAPINMIRINTKGGIIIIVLTTEITADSSGRFIAVKNMEACNG